MKLSIVINTRDRKDMLYALIKTIEKCTMPVSHEIIVVDDCSDKDYEKELKKKYPDVVFARNKTRMFLIRSRNIGWKKAKGDIIFFIDDDNEIKERNFFVNALEILKKHPDIGMLGCRTYYFEDPKRIMIGLNTFNKLTGRTTFIGMNQIDNGQLDGIHDTNDNPNAFFTRKAYLEKLGGFSPEIVQTFSEADYSERIRKLGLRVVQASILKVYHKSPVVNFKKMSARHMGGSPERFYYLMRNRYLFIKKFGSFWEKFFFTLVFSHLYTLYYLVSLLRLKNYEMIGSGIRGIWDGYICMFTNRIPNYYAKKYDLR